MRSSIKSSKVLCAILTVALLVSSLIGCGSSGSSASGSASSIVQSAVGAESVAGEVDYNKQATVSIASGSSGGSYYMVGTALAEIIAKYDPKLICSSETTGGTSENIALVTSGETTFGMGMSDDIMAAYSGKRDYENAPADNLRAICSGQSAPFQVIVLASSDIKTMADLKGKKVSLGPAGAPFFAPALLESAVGLTKNDYSGQYLGHDQAADALNDGDVDAVIAAVAYPAAAYANLAYTKELRFLSLSKEEMANALAANPTWKEGVMSANTYNGQTEDAMMPDIPVWLFTNVEVDNDIVYRITKQIFEHKDELGAIAKDAGYYNLETATQGVTIPIHPGAQRYFDEKK